MDGFTLRPAVPQDGPAILECHYSAVHEIARNDYSKAILDEWSPPVTAARVASYIPKSMTVIAAIPSGTVVGFGELGEQNELRALYVSAYASGLGVGSAILSELERLARLAGSTALTFDSSTTAAPFYSRRGYSVVSRGEHVLSSGGVMACVRMTKTL